MPPREDESNQPVKCGYCNKELKFKKKLRHHIDLVHGKGLPERKTIVSNEKQTNLLTFCTKKPRLDVSFTEDSSVAHTSDKAQTNDPEIISEDYLFSTEKTEDESNISKELSIDSTGILIEMRRNHKIVLERLDKIERNTKLKETNEERSKKTPIKVRKEREIPEDQDIERADMDWINEVKSISDFFNNEHDKIKMLRDDTFQFLYCASCFNEMTSKEAYKKKKDHRVIAGRKHN